MSTVRLNITLPEDVGEILSGVKNKSSYIADAIKEKRRTEEREKMKRRMAAAYKQASQEDYETYKEWEDTLADGIEK
jgi:hypothetical protein